MINEYEHKHLNMIVAKVHDLRLVKLCLSGYTWTCSEDSFSYNFYNDFEYYLCQPKHREVCLHFLNGVVVVYNGRLELEYNGEEWNSYSVFMDEEADLVVKL